MPGWSKTIYLPNGVGINDEANKLKENKTIDILIVGNKNPDLAHQIFLKIKKDNIHVDIIDGWISKKDFQNKLAKSHISVHLPKIVEEHYIPGVEAMMLESLVIIPDCVGNRSYSKHMKTCFITEYSLDGMLIAIEYMLKLNDEEKQNILLNAIKSSEVFLLNKEKSALYKILNFVEKI